MNPLLDEVTLGRQEPAPVHHGRARSDPVGGGGGGQPRAPGGGPRGQHHRRRHVRRGLGDRMRVSIVASGMARATQATNPEVWASRAQRSASRAGGPGDYRERLGAAIRGGSAGHAAGSHARDRGREQPGDAETEVHRRGFGAEQAFDKAGLLLYAQAHHYKAQVIGYPCDTVPAPTPEACGGDPTNLAVLPTKAWFGLVAGARLRF